MRPISIVLSAQSAESVVLEALLGILNPHDQIVVAAIKGMPCRSMPSRVFKIGATHIVEDPSMSGIIPRLS